MAAKPGFKARIYNGDFSLAAKLSEVSTNLQIDMHEVTTFADDGDKRFIPGQDTSQLSCEGFVDAAVNTDSAAWTAAQPFSYCPQGSVIGSVAVLVNALKSSYEVGTQVAGVASFSIAGQTDGATSLGGVSLHDEGAETGDGSASSVDNAAQTTAGGVAHLHVTAYSGLTNAIVTVEDSANNSDWSVIGTFATVTAATSERLAIAGTIRRYTRCTVDVTGTGSVTYACFLARN